MGEIVGKLQAGLFAECPHKNNHNFIKAVSLFNLGISIILEPASSRSSSFSYSLGLGPTYSCLGRLILLVVSFIISHHWVIQPTLLDTANSTVNMDFGMPIALQTMPVQKSTLGYSLRFMKQSSESARFQRLMASQSRGLVSGSSTTFRTQQHIFCMMVALGSKFLQTRCPNPINLNLEFLSFDFAITYSILLPSLCIYSNIVSTASLAPPWQGPHSDPIPAAMQAKGLASELPAILTVEVEAFCSWSAWQIQITYSALMISSAIQKSELMGLENIMYRKFFMQPYYFLGQTIGRPMAVRQAQAARVGILAISLMASYCRSMGLNRSQSECMKADSAPTTPTIIAIGWAQDLNPLQKLMIISLIIISPTTTLSNFSSSDAEGRQPYSSRQQVSIQVEFSASPSILYPRYMSSPFSPLMQVMLEMQLEVHMKPGSQVSSPAWESRPRTSIILGPRVPCRMGNSISWSPSLRIAFSGRGSGQTGFTNSRQWLFGCIRGCDRQ